MSSLFRPTRLAELTEEISFWTPQRSAAASIRYIDVSAISNESLSILAVDEVQAELAPSRARKVVRVGDTLFATVRPGLRRIAQVPQILDGAVASTALCVLRPRGDLVDPDFLFFAVTADEFVRRVEARQTGASYPAVRDTDVFDQEILIPPPGEQKEIARSLLAIRNAIGRAETAGANASALKQAALRQLFTSGTRADAQKETELGLVPDSWTVASLSNHFSVGSGGTPTRGVAEYWNGGTIPWVKTGEIDYSLIESTEERITPEGLANSAARLYEPGTLMMAMYGQGVTRGRVALLGIQAACNQACAAIAPLDDAVDVRYLYHFLTYRYAEIRNLAHGGQQQNLNMDIVKALPIAFPPDGASSEEQQEIVAILDAIDKKIDLHKRKRAALEQLFQTLLHKLMTGEIRVADLDLSALPAQAAVGA